MSLFLSLFTAGLVNILLILIGYALYRKSLLGGGGEANPDSETGRISGQSQKASLDRSALLPTVPGANSSSRSSTTSNASFHSALANVSASSATAPSAPSGSASASSAENVFDEAGHGRLAKSSLAKLELEKFNAEKHEDQCSICMEKFKENEKIRVLPCSHAFHSKCVDKWLTKRIRVCPYCRTVVYAAGEGPDPRFREFQLANPNVILNPAYFPPEENHSSAESEVWEQELPWRVPGPSSGIPEVGPSRDPPTSTAPRLSRSRANPDDGMTNYERMCRDAEIFAERILRMATTDVARQSQNSSTSSDSKQGKH